MNRERIKSFAMVVAISTFIACMVRLCLLEDFRIASDSMAPSLFTGDLVFVFKPEYNLRLPFSTYELVKFRRPSPSEVVAFTVPDRESETFVKRVVAVEGDNVAIQGGKLIINGVPATYTTPERSKDFDLVREKLPNGSEYLLQWDRDESKSYGPVDVPPGHFFVLGDNRGDSIDSRTWGPVPYSCLKGRVKLIWMSVASNGSVRGDRVGIWVK